MLGREFDGPNDGPTVRLTATSAMRLADQVSSLASKWLKIQGMGQSKICWAASLMDQTMVPRVRLTAASATGLADRVSWKPRSTAQQAHQAKELKPEARLLTEKFGEAQMGRDCELCELASRSVARTRYLKSRDGQSQNKRMCNK